MTSFKRRRGADELQRLTVAPSKARELGVDNFLTIEELRKKSFYVMAGQHEPVPGKLPNFVGQDDRGRPWLDATYEDIATRIVQSDDDDKETRVPPAALVGCSRSGKTRALIELGEKLRIQGKNVIFVSFNDATTYADNEASSRLESLLVRIAYAIATDDATSGMPLHDKRKLRFTTTEDAVLEWLDKNNCVLLMDELNKCISPEIVGSGDVVRFIRDNFVRTTGRYYVFSTHVSSTTKVVRMLGAASIASSERSVHLVGMPLVKNQSEWETLTNSAGDHPAWFGLSPGLIVTAKADRETLSAKWGDAFDNLRAALEHGKATVYDAVLLDLFAPEASAVAVVSQFEQFARTLDVTESASTEGDDQSRAARRSWAPTALHYVLSKCTQETAGEIANLLDSLKGTKIGGGDAWEIAVACALILRVEILRSTIAPATLKNALRVQKTSKPHEDPVGIFPDGLVECLDPNAPLTRSFARPQQDLNDVLSSLKDHEPGSRPEARLLRPAKADFKTYDLLLAFYPRDGGCEISGYQCKKGYDMDVGDPEPGVRSFLVLGAAKDKAKKDSNAAKAGWIVLTRAEIDAFMGPTLGPILEFEDALAEAESSEKATATSA